MTIHRINRKRQQSKSKAKSLQQQNSIAKPWEQSHLTFDINDF
jgi:hypothetical protein